jgi:hypothetical protein
VLQAQHASLSKLLGEKYTTSKLLAPTVGGINAGKIAVWSYYMGSQILSRQSKENSGAKGSI